MRKALFNQATVFVTSMLFSLGGFAANDDSATNDNRIISAGSSITELFYALGAQEQLVAIDVTSKHYDPDGALPQVGYHRQLSTEGLMSLTPTHLIGSHEMGPDTTLSQLSGAGIDVVTVPSGDTQSDLFKRIDDIAAITQTEEEAKLLKASLSSRLSNMEDRQLAQAPNVLFAMLSKGRPATIAGAETTINTIIEFAGAKNPAASETSSYKPLSIEAVVSMQPDYLLVSERAWAALGGHDGIVKEFPLLAATPAAQHQRIIPIAGSAIIGGLGIESIELSDELHNTFSTQ
jgi:iron complex transport system substrate-binding protein